MAEVKRYDPVSHGMECRAWGSWVNMTDYDREHELRLQAERERDELLEKARATLDAYRKEYGE